jgi:DNA-binding ferritin-like protein
MEIQGMQSLLEQLESEHKKELLPAEDSGCDVTGMPEQLIGLSSLVKELGTQAHLVHVNLEASYFFGVHSFLQEQYEEHTRQFDRVAELVRTLDTYMPMCRLGLTNALPCFHDIKSYEARQMLLTYMANLEDCGALVKQIWSMAHETKAIDIAHEMEGIAHNCYKAAWQIKATLRKS